MTNKCAIALPDGSCYDPDQAQDHEGLQFVSGAQSARQSRRDPRRDPRNFMREPAWLKCPECGSEDRYMILAESHPMGDGMVQIYCAKCHASWPVIQAHQPQMSDHVAKQLGVPVPDPGIDIDLDLGDEE